MGQYNFDDLPEFSSPTKPRSINLGRSSDKRGPIYVHQTLFGFYVQDDWRGRASNLTLELWRAIMNRSHCQPRPIIRFAVLTTITSPSETPVNTFWGQETKTLHNFEPRVGFSRGTPFRNGKTAGPWRLWKSLMRCLFPGYSPTGSTGVPAVPTGKGCHRLYLGHVPEGSG